MFSVEIKINGTMIKHIYGINVKGTKTCTYDVDVYDVQTRAVKQHSIKHKRSEGINKLIKTILEKEEA